LFCGFFDFIEIENKTCRDNFLANLIVDKNKRDLKK